MLTTKNIFLTFFIFLVGSSGAIAAENGNSAPDNTSINRRDQREAELTADQQGMGTRDTELTQKIRKALVKDGSLSVNAHNVKIITTNGHVTLKGPVSSVREKDEVTELARSIAGKNFVTDELDVLKSE